MIAPPGETVWHGSAGQISGARSTTPTPAAVVTGRSAVRSAASGCRCPACGKVQADDVFACDERHSGTSKPGRGTSRRGTVPRDPPLPPAGAEVAQPRRAAAGPRRPGGLPCDLGTGAVEQLAQVGERAADEYQGDAAQRRV